MKDTADWLAAFQRAFTDVVRAPLDRSSGTLRATTDAYPAELVARVAQHPRHAPTARLAVYNRQYWFRLFGVFQHELPITTAVLGPWALNGAVAEFLAAHPPNTADLARVVDGFDRHLAHHVPPTPATTPALAVTQAVTIDQAFRTAFAAPGHTAFRPTGADAARLPQSRLVPAPSLTLVRESWPLVRMHPALSRAGATAAIALPDPLAAPADWAVFRTDEGTRAEPLDPREAALLRAVQRAPLARALADLEAGAPASERPQLATRARAWLAASVERGFWTGLEVVA